MLKPLDRQVILITGASSGIGLATARLAAERGAKVILVSRNQQACEQAAAEIRDRGGKAIGIAADVGDRAALEAAAERATQEFGGIDTWVNDAGTSTYGTLEAVPIEDQRKLFDTNYWGVVHGSLIAAKLLRHRGGGAIVNVGSVLSDRAVNYQGTYSATKHAVKAFTDALRIELGEARAPISVTLIKPSGVETAFQEHARNLTDAPGVKVPPPAYDPRLVARAILHAAEHPVRDLVVGFGGHVIALLGALFPRLTDFAMRNVGYVGQTSNKRPDASRADNLYAPKGDGTERSLTRPAGPVRTTSLFLEAQMRPIASMAVLAGVGALAAGAIAARRAGPLAARTRLRRSAW